MPNVFNSAASTAFNATPAGAAFNAAKGFYKAPGKIISAIFGGGTPTWKRSQTLQNYKAARDSARLGNRDAIEQLARMAGLRKPDYPGTKYEIIRNRAKVAYENNMATWGGRGNSTWAGSGGRAPAAESTSRAETPRSLMDGVPPVLRSCKYGPRGADGYCPTKPPRGMQQYPTGSGRGGRGSRPCKYGARDEDGRCPTKSSRYGSATSRRAQGRAERAVESAVKRGVGNAARSGALARGAVFVAKASLLAAAGYGAYWLTTQALKLRRKTYQDMYYDLANLYRQARQKAVEKAGRGLTPAENSELSQWYKAGVLRIQDYERRGLPISALTFKD